MRTKLLSQTNINEVELVGGKNASLGEMINNLTSLNINIPNGFIVTTIGYDDFINYNNISTTINTILSSLSNENEIKASSHKIRDAITNGVFSDDFKQEILHQYQQLSLKYNQENTDVAIRSSSSAEDMPDASFAGQQDTYLNISGIDDVLHKIKLCFASLFNERAVHYRNNMNYDNKKIKLSVCVQKMVRSDNGSSGVAFSLDTESGFKDIVLINASYGLGKLIVDGSVKPDEYIVFKPTLNQGYDSIVDKKLGEKSIKLIYDTSYSLNHEPTKTIQVATQDRNRFCIPDDIILKLSKWVIQIENYYTKIKNQWCPVDVEWAYDNKDLYIVQARPETIHSRKTDDTLIEYKMLSINKTPKLQGIAVGDSISSGNVKILFDINDTDNFNNGDILVTTNTDPDWEPIMKKSSCIITEKGGRTCHAAIVARELGITCIVGATNCTQILKNNELVTASCVEGETGYIYEGKLDYEIIKTKISDLPKIKTKIMMNVASPDQAYKIARIPNSGVGLAREEFIINNFIQVHPLALINYDKITDQTTKQMIDEKLIGYNDPIDYYIKKLTYGIARIGSAFYPNKVIVRFSDFKSNEYANLLGGKDYEPEEENPMIGWRGASRYYSHIFKEAFGLECKAIKYVREVIGLTNVIVMIPFCRTVDECIKVTNTMKEYGLERGRNGLEICMMCEIPSNVILADQFLQHVDSYSIGSNDLTQTILGCDRDSELVSSIYDERNDAVKIMIKQAIQTCKKYNKKIGICGQGPSDYPDFAQFLVENEIDTISLTPDSVIKTIKAIHEIEKLI